MTATIRPARLEDKAAIAAFTTDTFPWGDYVANVFDEWLADPDGQLLVAVDEDDEAIGMARLALLSPTQAWAQAARVHPGHRRRGLATLLTQAGEEWARRRGAVVVRLVTEGWNDAARRQVEKAGFRRVSRWVMTQRPVGSAAPVAEGNGGRRTPAGERLRRAPSAEAEPAFLAWSTGGLVTAAHGLYPAVGWMWRQITLEDVAQAARRRALWESAAGWLIGELEEDLFRVGWLSTAPEDAYRLVRASIDLADEQGAERLRFLIPEVDWLVRAMRRGGLEVNPLVLYEKPVEAAPD